MSVNHIEVVNTAVLGEAEEDMERGKRKTITEKVSDQVVQIIK